MDRLRHAFDARRQHVVGAVGAEHGDAPLAEPRRDRGVESGRLAVHLPRSVLGPAGPPPGPDEQHVAALHPQARLALPGFEVLDADRRAGFEVVDALQARNVHQDPAADDPLLVVGDPQPGAAFLGHLVGANVAVVQRPLVHHVAKRVHVRVGVAVIGERVAVAAEGTGTVGAEHLVADRRSGFDVGLGQVGVRQRDRDAGRGQGQRAAALLRGHEVERAQLVVAAPAAPVRELGHPAGDRLRRDRVRPLRSKRRRRGPCSQQPADDRGRADPPPGGPLHCSAPPAPSNGIPRTSAVCRRIGFYTPRVLPRSAAPRRQSPRQVPAAIPCPASRGGKPAASPRRDRGADAAPGPGRPRSRRTSGKSRRNRART